jgi:hypothetical protein
VKREFQADSKIISISRHASRPLGKKTETGNLGSIIEIINGNKR